LEKNKETGFFIKSGFLSFEESDMDDEKIPFPPEDFMRLVCGGNDPNLSEQFIWAGKLVTAMLRDENMILSDTCFIDVGCGCGRVARYLMNMPLQSYTGFDRHSGMIRWCQQEITPLATHFAFHCFEIKSVYSQNDGEYGKIEADDFCFPFADHSFDAALLASVFTHMPLKESVHYLYELYRVVKPGGKILLSVFFSDREPYRENANFYYESKEFLKMVGASGFDCRFRETLYQHNWYILSK
jgi:ubiquinone/menaquinone biosynthesis C-methylase UbiE